MKAVLPVLGSWRNLSAAGGQAYPIGSAAAIVVMGVWIKRSMDKRFERLRTCIHNRGMPDGRGFFPPDKEIFRGNPGGFQGKLTQYGGKKTAQTASNGCEYRF